MRRDWRAFWSQHQDPRYGSHDPDFVRNHGREISILLGDPSGKSVLELGCGSGTLYQALGFPLSRVYRGVDFSQSMLAAFHAAHPGVDTVCSDASSYREPNEYDIMYSNALVQYFNRAMFERYVANARRMLAPGGRLIVCSVLWNATRAFYHLAPPNGSKRSYLRQLSLLGLSYVGIDRIGTWYSARDFRRVARRNGLDVQFFGSLQFPYRFHAVFKSTSDC